MRHKIIVQQPHNKACHSLVEFEKRHSKSLIIERITSNRSNIFADNCGASLTHGTSWYSLENTSHSPQTIFNKNNVFKNCTTARFICN